MALETLDPQSSPDVAEPALPVGKAAVATGPYALPTGGVATGVDESLLENMRKLIADREAQKNSFGESLRDAQAWWSGGAAGPGEALRARDKQREEQDATTFGMKSQLAQYQAQQEMARAQQAANEQQIGGGAPSTPGAQGASQFSPQIQQWLANLNRTNPAQAAAELAKLNQQAFKDQSGFTNNPAAYATSVENKVMGPNGQWTIDKTTPLAARAQQPSAPVQQPSAPGNVNVENIKTVESGGNPNAISPKGAEGVLQVMPNTQTDPGFGVKPAKDKSPAELERVGRDYYAAMQNKYGHDTLAAIAYNYGPNRTDDWLKSGADFNKLTAETKEYIGRVNLANAMQSRKPAPAAAPSFTEIANQQAINQAAGVSQAGEQGKLFAATANDIMTKGMDAGERQVRHNATLELLNDPQLQSMVGKYQTGDKSSAFIQQMQSGIEAGNFGAIGLKDLQENLAKQGASREAIRKFSQLESFLKQNELEWRKNYLKGQGSVSDMEGNTVKQAIGDVKDPVGKLKTLAATMRERALFDGEINSSYKQFKKQNGSNASLGDFLDSDAYDALNVKHNARLATVLNVDPNKLRANTGVKIINGQENSTRATATGNTYSR